MDADGNFYLTPLRPIVKTRAKYDKFLDIYTFEHESRVYKEKYGDDAEIKALYFRTSDEDILNLEKRNEFASCK